MKNTILKFSGEELKLLSQAFEKRITETDEDFKSREKVSKSAYNYYVMRYKNVLEKIKQNKEGTLSKSEINTIRSCSNEALYYFPENSHTFSGILKKCGFR